MSVNILDIKCDKCNFRSSSNRLWGRYVYELPHGEWLTIPRSAGWCYDCKNIQSIETLIIEEAKLANEINSHLNDEDKSKKDSFIKSVLSLFGLFRKYSKENSKSTEFDVEQVRNKFLSLRQDPAKCLICGSSNINIIKFPVPVKGEKSPIALSHQNCGGTLYVRESDTSFHCKFASRVYDIQGNYMRMEKDWS